eukprot:gene22700-165_t
MDKAQILVLVNDPTSLSSKDVLHGLNVLHTLIAQVFPAVMSSLHDLSDCARTLQKHCGVVDESIAPVRLNIDVTLPEQFSQSVERGRHMQMWWKHHRSAAIDSLRQDRVAVSNEITLKETLRVADEATANLQHQLGTSVHLPSEHYALGLPKLVQEVMALSKAHDDLTNKYELEQRIIPQALACASALRQMQKIINNDPSRETEVDVTSLIEQGPEWCARGTETATTVSSKLGDLEEYKIKCKQIQEDLEVKTQYTEQCDTMVGMLKQRIPAFHEQSSLILASLAGQEPEGTPGDISIALEQHETN